MDISICLKYIEVEPLIYEMTLLVQNTKKSDSQSCRNPPTLYKSSKTLYLSVNKHTENERVP